MKDCFKQLKTVEESVKINKVPAENGEDVEVDDDETEDDTDGKFHILGSNRHFFLLYIYEG